MKYIKLIVLSMLISIHAIAEETNIIEKYEDYIEILESPVEKPPAQVVEFFSYNCIHCYHIEPFMEAFLASNRDKLTFTRFQVKASPKWELSQIAFAAARIAGVEKEVHHQLFEHVQKTGGFNAVEDVKVFFNERGMKKVAEEHLESEEAQALREQINNLVKSYKLKSVPQFIVNGKYKISFIKGIEKEEFVELLNEVAKLK